MTTEKPTLEQSSREQDDFLQEALEETFPASDPIAPGRPSHSRTMDEAGAGATSTHSPDGSSSRS